MRYNNKKYITDFDLAKYKIQLIDMEEAQPKKDLLGSFREIKKDPV